MDIHLENICKKKDKHEILKHIDLHIETGKVTAILGPSGSGKTTLLKIISGLTHQTTGYMLNQEGKRFSQLSLSLVSAYIDQDNQLLHNELTVYEQIEFSYIMRNMGTNIKDVRNIIQILGLYDEQRIKNLSGGQKRRVSIAMEVILNKSIIVCDEPVSGLDSFNAKLVIDYLHKLATEDKKTVLISLHQPSDDMISFIDNFIFLSKGRQRFQGNVAELKIKFEMVSTDSNVCEWYINKLAIENITDTESYQNIQTPSHEYEMLSIHYVYSFPLIRRMIKFISVYLKVFIRDKPSAVITSFVLFLIGLIFTLMVYDVGNKSNNLYDIKIHTAVYLLLLMSISIVTTFTVSAKVLQIRLSLIHEIKRCYINPLCATISFIFIFSVLSLLISSVATLLPFFTLHINSTYSEFITTVIMIIGLCILQSMILVYTFDVYAIQINSLLNAMIPFMTGVILPLNNIPTYSRWLQYIIVVIPPIHMGLFYEIGEPEAYSVSDHRNGFELFWLTIAYLLVGFLLLYTILYTTSQQKIIL